MKALVIREWQEANFNESPFSRYLCLLTLEQQYLARGKLQ
jgi:hypothetical protein